MNENYNKIRHIKETVCLGLTPTVEKGVTFTEAKAADLNLSEVRAIYPLIKAVITEKVNKNFRNYTTNSVKSNALVDGLATGYRSFVSPYAKPVLSHHNDYDGTAHGRVIWAGYKNHGQEVEQVIRPGTETTYKGTGYLPMVCAVTEELGMLNILNGTFDTVSIGATAHKVIDSISGTDILACWKRGERPPEFYRGQEYVIEGEKKLCYWNIPSWEATEISFVHTPSEVYAKVMAKNIGEDKAKLLLTEKVMGKDEFKFYDLFTKEEIDLTSILESGEFLFDTSFDFQDSWKSNKEYFTFAPATTSLVGAIVNPSITTITEMANNLAGTIVIPSTPAPSSAKEKRTLADILNEVIN